VFVERIELQPIDPQTNGPQLFYGKPQRAGTARGGDFAIGVAGRARSRRARSAMARGG